MVYCNKGYVSSFSASVDIYGALLRLRTWNNASIYFITTEQHIIVDEPEER